MNSSPRHPFSLLATAGILPFDALEDIRKQSSIVWDASMQSWLVLDFETCKTIESDETAFANAYRRPNPIISEIKGGENITSMQDAAHKRIRHLHLKLLSPVAVKRYRDEYITPILDYLIESIETAGSADLAVQFGDQLPPRLTAALFGMPWRDDRVVADLLRLNGEIMAWIGTRHLKDPEQEARARVASRQMNELILPFIQHRRANPASDFIGRVLSEAPDYYEQISDEDVIALCRELLLAASDTTTHGIANALYLFLTDPLIRPAFERDQDAAADALVEEALRFYGSVQFQMRYARQDCLVNGVTVRKDDCIILHHAAANRDPAVYRSPQTIDLDRTPAKKHLAFGIGPRICPGAALARAEIKDALKLVFNRLPNVRLDPDATPPAFDGFFTRSWRPLNVIFG